MPAKRPNRSAYKGHPPARGSLPLQRRVSPARRRPSPTHLGRARQRLDCRSVRDPGLSSGAAGHAAGDPAAAEVDGARPPQLLRYVILPLLRPTILVLGVLALVYAFKSFDYIYVMTFGGPGTASTTLPFLSYRLAFEIYRYSQGASVALITVAIVLLLALLYMRQVRREERA